MVDPLLIQKAKEKCAAADEAMALAINLEDPAAERRALGALVVIACDGAQPARDAVRLSGLYVAHFVGDARATLAGRFLEAISAAQDTGDPLAPLLAKMEAAELGATCRELDLACSADPVGELLAAVETLDGLLTRRWAVAVAWCLAGDAANLVTDPLATLEGVAATCAAFARRARARLELRALAI